MWFKPFWEYYFNCSLKQNKLGKGSCPEVVPQNTTKLFSKIKPTINAVYAFANALDLLKKDKCNGQSGICSSMINYPGDYFFKNYLSNVTLKDSFDNPIQLFDITTGDLVEPKYAIYQYQLNETTGNTDYTEVGNWFRNKLRFEMDKLVWPITSKEAKGFTSRIPTSSCTTKCMTGQVLKSNRDGCCSGVCSFCEEYEYVDKGSTCKDCNEFCEDCKGWWPTADKTSCSKPSIVVFILITNFLFVSGVILTIGILITFDKHQDKSVMRRSSKEHCIITLWVSCFVS